jgi:hypothetical protein
VRDEFCPDSYRDAICLLWFIQVGNYSSCIYPGLRKASISLTETLRSDGFTVFGEPRTTGDGYFESVVLDVEGNRIELLA